MDSCIRGYHVYKEVWTAVFGELYTEREISNVIDCYAVAVKKDSGETVGHLPKKISSNLLPSKILKYRHSMSMDTMA